MILGSAKRKRGARRVPQPLPARPPTRSALLYDGASISSERATASSSSCSSTTRCHRRQLLRLWVSRATASIRPRPGHYNRFAPVSRRRSMPDENPVVRIRHEIEEVQGDVTPDQAADDLAAKAFSFL